MAATMGGGRGRAQRTAQQSLPSVYTLILNMTFRENVVDVSQPDTLLPACVHRRCYLMREARFRFQQLDGRLRGLMKSVYHAAGL